MKKRVVGDITINKLGYICVCSRTLRMTSYANCNLKLLAQAKYFWFAANWGSDKTLFKAYCQIFII